VPNGIAMAGEAVVPSRMRWRRHVLRVVALLLWSGCQTPQVARPVDQSLRSEPPDPGCFSRLAELPVALRPGTAGAPLLQVSARGTQNYSCVVLDGGPAWSPAVPDAVLYACQTNGGGVGTHFAGPTWRWNGDGSTFVGSKSAGFVSLPSPDDPAHDVPWLLLPRKAGSDAGILAGARFVQRVGTVGGVAADADAGCDRAAAAAGLTVQVPYRATYIFY
jgi:hypothetical protein